MVFTGYGDQFRRQRRLMSRAVGPQVVAKYHPMLEIETKAVLKRLLTSPENYTEHLIRYVPFDRLFLGSFGSNFLSKLCRSKGSDDCLWPSGQVKRRPNPLSGRRRH